MAGARSLTEFQKAFPDETSCAAFLFKRRWPDGFVCPACGNGRAAALKSRAYNHECSGCGRQTSITAGTAMHRTKLPLTLWFWAAHLIVDAFKRHPPPASCGLTGRRCCALESGQDCQNF